MLHRMLDLSRLHEIESSLVFRRIEGAPWSWRVATYILVSTRARNPDTKNTDASA